MAGLSSSPVRRPRDRPGHQPRETAELVPDRPVVLRALFAPVLPQFAVVEPSELARVGVEPVGSSLHLVEIMPMITGRRLLFGPLAHDVELFPGQFENLRES